MNSNNESNMTIGSIKGALKTLETHIKHVKPGCSHLSACGLKSVASAIELLKQHAIIALPTDTIYGLAGLAQSDEAIGKLYDIKKRDPLKPLAICVGEIEDVKSWAKVDSLPKGLLESLFPGPVTIVLKRSHDLNPRFNPHIENVGIRIPDAKFIRDIAKHLRQPLALTSANESNKPSTIDPQEFSELWWQLGAVFHSKDNSNVSESARVGSTVVDLSEPGKYRILREGSAEVNTLRILQKFHLVNGDS